MRDGSTAASRSASVGRIRPARRAATSTDTTATATPARNAMRRAGTEAAVSCTLNQAGDRPRPAIQRASSGAQITPSRQPRAEPATPTRAASARTIHATCRGVAPMVRSRARSRRRWATESPNAEAITVMATKPEIAAAIPRKVVRPASSALSCTASGSAWCRAAPLSTCSPGSAAARLAVAGSSVTSASAPGESRAASASVKKIGCSPVRGGTVPTIVKASGPPAVSTVTGRPMTAWPATTIWPSVLGGWPELRR